MHILYIHQHFSTPAGSSGTRSYEMAKKLIARGHQVTMICGSYRGGNTGLTSPFANGRRTGIVDGINVIEFELSYGNSDNFFKRTVTFLRYSIRSVKLALVSEYDLLFATSTPLTAAIPGIISKWCRNKPFVFEVRDLWPELPKAMGVIKNPLILSLMRVLEWASYKSAHTLIALSPGIQDGIQKITKSKKQITMIPNGCDIALFTTKSMPNTLSKYNESDFIAIYSGTHGIANGLHALIETAKVLKNRKINNIKIILIGQGREKEKLIALAKEYQLDNIEFLPPVNKEALAAIFSRANVGLQILENVPAFYYGTSPNKFFDYIAAGLPVIINYPGWLAEKVDESQCGITVAPNDPCNFADALISLSKNPLQLKSMSEASSRLAKSEFDRNNLSDRFSNSLEICYDAYKLSQ